MFKLQNKRCIIFSESGEVMKLSDKIQHLRKEKHLSQEELAEICGVSRQSVSKWEADIALPEIEKLIILSETFGVSTDVLLRDEFEIDTVKEVHHCGKNTITKATKQVFEGVLIKESLEDDSVIDCISVNKIELWDTGGTPKYWTVLFFTSEDVALPQKLSKVMKNGSWFVDFKSGKTKLIVFRDKILKYTIGNKDEKEYVCNECRKLGITDDEMGWSE